MSKHSTQTSSEPQAQPSGLVSDADIAAVDALWQPLSGGADWCEHQMDDEDGEMEMRCASGAVIGAHRELLAGDDAKALDHMRAAIKHIDAVGYYSLKHYYEVMEVEDGRTLLVRLADSLEAAGIEATAGDDPAGA